MLIILGIGIVCPKTPPERVVAPAVEVEAAEVVTELFEAARIPPQNDTIMHR
jgi:hypothetical protein